jgi:histidyl-tRNA synthetase
MSKKFRPVRGTRDFLPEEMIRRQYVLDTVRKVFENFGFNPLETPALESWDVLSAKGAGGSEILKETYNFRDRGGRRIGLRYDLTVPLARVVSSIPNLTLPFKRYQISRVWRYGDVARGRLREFWQADIDTVGSSRMSADAEVIACTGAVLKELGFKGFCVRLNSRKILNAMVKYAGIKGNRLEIFKIIDKLDKIGFKGVEKELKGFGLKQTQIKKLFKLVKISGSPDTALKKADKLLMRVKEGEEGIKELKDIISYLKKMSPKLEVKIDLSLARGLDYYTGPIFEFWAGEGVGSVAGGGRYDEMIGIFSGKELPATGISIGIERVLEVMKEKKMVKSRQTKVQVFVAGVKEKFFSNALKTAGKLRDAGVHVSVDLMGRNLRRQLEYANSRQIPFAVLIGEKELKEKKLTLRDMVSGKEEKLGLRDIVEKLKPCK